MRKRTGKKIFSAIAACLVAVTGNFPAMAAEIKKVRLRLTAEDFDESGRPEAEFQTDSEAYEVSGIEKNEEDIYEVELTALEGNEFAVMTQSDIRLTGIRASCSRAVRKNGRGTLSLSVKAEGLCDVTGEIGNARFRETMAEWDKADNAYAYMVLLYRNSKRIGHPHKTQGTTYDFSPLMRERGIYHYKVYPLSINDKKGIPVESEWLSLDEDRAGKNRMEYADRDENQSGWELCEEGWRYWLKDGTFPQDNWMYLDENWYYFDADGYMAADRTAMKEGRLCWLDSSGLLSEGEEVPDES